MTPRAAFLLIATYTMAAILGWCVVAVIVAVWFPRF